MKSKPCIFLGYSMNQDAYIYFESSEQKIFISMDVVFDEHDFSLNTCTLEDTECND